MILDLSEVADPAALDGRSITVESGAGHIVVIVPPDTDVAATASVGAGELQVFGTTHDGLGAETTQIFNVPNEVATLHLDVQMGFGQIEIRAS
ncbi:MAG: LiaF-related protein [Nocardioides sp.]